MRVINWCHSTTCTKWLFLIYTGFVFEKILFCMIFFTNKIRISQISVRIRPEPDPNLFLKSRSGRNRTRIFFFISRSGRIRLSDKNSNIRPDPDPDSESDTSLIKTELFLNFSCIKHFVRIILDISFLQIC